MKRVLVLSWKLPYPLISGGHHAIYNGIACLEGLAEVFLIYPTRESIAKKREYQELEVRLPFVKCIPYIIPESRHDFRWFIKCCRNRVRALLGKQSPETKTVSNPTTMAIPMIGLPYLTDHFSRFVLSVIKKKRIDIVQAEMVENIRIIDSLPAYVKTVFVHHELRWVRNDLLLKQIEVSPETALDAEIAKKEEIEYLNRYDQVIVLSQVDHNKLLSAGVTSKIITSFAVVDGHFVLPSSCGMVTRLTFIGPSRHFPNYEGISWFLKNCWQELLSIYPDCRLQIFGEWDEGKINSIRCHFDGVDFMGFVDDLEEMVKDSIFVVPLNIGSGIRMKILEAARLGVPVVSTTIGAEGLPVINGESILIADTPSDFISAIVKLQDTSFRNQLVVALQGIVKRQYSIEALRENRRSIYQ